MNNVVQGTSRIDWGNVQLDVAQPAGAPSEFMQTVKQAIGQVQELQGEAEKQVVQMLHGNGQDVHSAMIAVEKADLSFQLMMQVRNKIVAAYQEIARMPF
jgi:flagellar hook-basal body complex protein FliE